MTKTGIWEMCVDMDTIIRPIYKDMVYFRLDLRGQWIDVRGEVADCFAERR
jgi:hypothetical protein